MTIFVIGPSNVGKSTLVKKLDSNQVLVINSDDSIKKRHGKPSDYLQKVGNKQFFEETVKYVQQDIGAVTGKVVVIDIGAGALQYANDDFDAIAKWLSTGRTVLIIDEPENIIERDFKLKRSLEEYKASEFSETRQHLYDLADDRIDVRGRSVEEVFSDFSSLFETITKEKENIAGE